MLPHLEHYVSRGSPTTENLAEAAMYEDDHIRDTMTWPSLFEDLILPTELDSSAMPLYLVASSASRNTKKNKSDNHLQKSVRYFWVA